MHGLQRITFNKMWRTKNLVLFGSILCKFSFISIICLKNVFFPFSKSILRISEYIFKRKKISERCKFELFPTSTLKPIPIGLFLSNIDRDFVHRVEIGECDTCP